MLTIILLVLAFVLALCASFGLALPRVNLFALAFAVYVLAVLLGQPGVLA